MFHVKQLKKEETEERREEKKKEKRKGKDFKKKLAVTQLKIRQNVGTTGIQPFYSFKDHVI